MQIETISDIGVFEQSADRFAGSIDALIGKGWYRRGALFVAAAKRHIPAGGAILDYGCGPGRISRLLGLEGFRLHGVDPSAQMIRQAQSQDLRGLSATFEVIDPDSGLGEGGPYDGIVCSSVIEFVPDCNDLLRRFRGRLKDSGVLLISYANRMSLVRAWSDHVTAPDAPHLRAQKHRWNWRTFRSTLQSCGFAPIGEPRFFDSPFDRRGRLSLLSRSPFIGILGFAAARKV